MILVASTLAAYKADDVEKSESWLAHAAEWKARGDVVFFAALQTGHGHDLKFASLRRRLAEVDAVVWEFSLDDESTAVTTETRLIGIVTGRNLAHEYLNRHHRIDAILFLDSDVWAPADAIDRLLEVDHQLVCGDVRTYQLNGPKITWKRARSRRYDIYREGDPTPIGKAERKPFPEDADVRDHMSTAGFLLVRRDAARLMRWRTDIEGGLTDDPAFDADARRLGFGGMWVRHDVVGRHFPEHLPPMERRGHDRSIRRPVSAAKHPTVAIIPFRGQLAMTRAVVAKLKAYGGCDALLLFDNGSTGTAVGKWLKTVEQDEGVTVFSRPDASIYEMWNEGWLHALSLADAPNVAFLNNDIGFGPGFLQVLASKLRAAPPTVWGVYPDYRRHVSAGTVDGGLAPTHGTFRHDGMCGWAFMIKGEAHTVGGLPLVDTQFGWWYGDDDLVFNVEKLGYTFARVNGLPLDHLSEGTARHFPKLEAQKGVDREAFVAKWGNR